MAPPKPFVQMQFMLHAMGEAAHHDDERWDEVSENFDLLLSRVELLRTNQTRLEAQMDLGNKIMLQMLKDQQLLAKQIEISGKGVARLTLDRAPIPEEDDPPSPTLSHASRG